ncbi:MAG: hypothetical protein V4438_00015 [Patescibacteria group bacterium]
MEKAKILIGIRQSYSDGTELECGQSCIALTHSKGNGRNSKFFPARNPKFPGQEKLYIEHCREAGETCGIHMKKLGVKEYEVTNGERIRHTTHEQVRCEEMMPDDGIEAFVSALEKVLFN